MVLSYAKYIELMTALDEHCKGEVERNELQNAIFNHYMEKEHSLVAENVNGSKRLFLYRYQRGKKNKIERQAFRSFMNEKKLS